MFICTKVALRFNVLVLGVEKKIDWLFRLKQVK